MVYTTVDETEHSIIIVAGVSGAGKSSVLDVLEDWGYYCIENLPHSLLLETLKSLKDAPKHHQNIAISLSSTSFWESESTAFEKVKLQNDAIQYWYVTADPEILVERYNETRRRHPLSGYIKQLSTAIKEEIHALSLYSELTDYIIDTSDLSVQKLHYKLKDKLLQGQDFARPAKTLINLFSFGFKYGRPKRADFIFDVRVLPNPYWVKPLRAYTGKDQPVVEYLEKEPLVKALLNDLEAFLVKWCHEFEKQSRSYVEIAIGCTGGQHRSVYMVEKLFCLLKQRFENVSVAHRELSE